MKFLLTENIGIKIRFISACFMYIQNFKSIVRLWH